MHTPNPRTANRRSTALLAGLFVALVALGVGLPPVRADSTVTTLAVGSGTNLAPPNDVIALDDSPAGELRLGDRIWEDVNRDGVQDEGEAGLAGIIVALERASIDGHRSEIDRTITDLDGRYEFENLTAAWYGIRVLAPAGWRVSTPGAVPADPIADDAAIGTRTGTVVSTDARFVAEDQPVTEDLDVGIFLPDAAIRIDSSDPVATPEDGERNGAWTLDVANSGPEDDPGPLLISVPVPANLDARQVDAEGWECALEIEPARGDDRDTFDTDIQVLSCIRPEGLVDGASAPITVTGRALGSNAADSDRSPTTVLANVVDRVDDDQLNGLGELAAAPQILGRTTDSPSMMLRLVISLFGASAAVFAISRAAWRPADLTHL